MNRKAVFFLCTCLTHPAIGLAATLGGVVTDGVKDTKLGGVEVICRIGDETRQTYTDAEGNYRFTGLEQGKEVAVQFRKIGFVPSPDETSVKLLSSANRLNRLLYARGEDSDYYRKLGDYIASLQALSGFRNKSDFVKGLGLPTAATRIVLAQLGASESELQADEIEDARGACRRMFSGELKAADLEDIQIVERGRSLIVRGSVRDARGTSTILECVAAEDEDGSWSATIRQPGDSGG